MFSHMVLNASYTHNKQLEGIGGIKEKKKAIEKQDSINKLRFKNLFLKNVLAKWALKKKKKRKFDNIVGRPLRIFQFFCIFESNNVPFS